jgi:hypothetical protein
LCAGVKITLPGIYAEFPVADYYRDPCPSPSLTQSGAKIILEKSPLHAWHEHPRLNPSSLSDSDDKKFDVANIAHALVLGRGRKFVVLDYEDWRTKDAQKRREEASQAGKLAVLRKHYDLAGSMAEVLVLSLNNRGLRLFDGPERSEIVIAWNEGKIWFRQMLDWLSADAEIMADYKTTAVSAAPGALAARMASDGWDVQAAMAERGLAVVAGEDPDRRYIFVVQETFEPFAVSIMEISESVLSIGRRKLQSAAWVWRECMESGVWPGYPTQIIVPDYPGFAAAQWLDREETEFERVEFK